MQIKDSQRARTETSALVKVQTALGMVKERTKTEDVQVSIPDVARHKGN